MIDINKYDLLFQYSKVLEKEYMNLYSKEKLIEKLNSLIPKKIIPFEHLFKEEYRNKIADFINWLKRERYVNISNQIIEKDTKFARIYYLLRDNGIVNPNTNYSDAMRSYFGKFNVSVVERINESADKPQVLRRVVTSTETRAMEMLDMTAKEKKTLLNIFIDM